ncbi:uncharacterized protein LOC132547616 [Ylistrum balloti]|uniref:uncharacterized protein LOC132547616 n=1 Tax=Ylistrum balloti TaxID=509963 RepID=UPI002905F281|nr:uncharacterized protein LOC132547616 [Ylistrum balloti]
MTCEQDVKEGRTSVQERPLPYYDTQYQRSQGVAMLGMDSTPQQFLRWDYPNDYNVAQNLHYARQFPYEHENKSCVPSDSNLYWISSQTYDSEKTSGWNHPDKPPIPKLTIRPVKQCQETDMQGRRGSSSHYPFSFGRGPLSRRGHHSRPFPSPRPTPRGRGRSVGRPRGSRLRGGRPSPVSEKKSNSSWMYRSSGNDDISALKTKCLIQNQLNDVELTNPTLKETHNVDDDIKTNSSVTKTTDIVCPSGLDGLEDSMSMKENSATLQHETEAVLLANSSKRKDNIEEIECEFDATNYYDPKLRQTRISLNDLPLSSGKVEFALQKKYPDMFSKHIQVKVQKLQSSNAQECESPKSCASPLSSVTEILSTCSSSLKVTETTPCSDSSINSIEQDTSNVKTDSPMQEPLTCPNIAVRSPDAPEDLTNKPKMTHVPHFNISKLKSKLKSVKIPGPPTQQSIETQTESFALDSPPIDEVLPIQFEISDESPSLLSVSETFTNEGDSSQLPPPILEPIDCTTIRSVPLSMPESIDLAVTADATFNDDIGELDENSSVVIGNAEDETDTKTREHSNDVTPLTVIMVQTNETISDGALEASSSTNNVITIETSDPAKDESQGCVVDNDIGDVEMNDPNNKNSSDSTQQVKSLDVALESNSVQDDNYSSILQEADSFQNAECSESVGEGSINANDKSICDENTVEELKDVDSQTMTSSTVDSNIVSTEPTFVHGLTQVTEEVSDVTNDTKESVFSTTELEESVIANKESLDAVEYVMSNVDFIGAEEHIVSNVDSVEETAIDPNQETNMISLVTVTVETSDDRINKAEAESAVTALFYTNNLEVKGKDVTSEEKAPTETGYDSDASDATVRYSDDEDHQSLKIVIPPEDHDIAKDSAGDTNETNKDANVAVSSPTPEIISEDNKETPVCENNGEDMDLTSGSLPESTDVPEVVDVTHIAGKRKVRGKKTSNAPISVTLNNTTKPDGINTPISRQKRKYASKKEVVKKKPSRNKNTEEKLTLIISRSPRKTQVKTNVDITDHPSAGNVINDKQKRKRTRSKNSVNGRSTSRRIYTKRSRLTVAKRGKRGRKTEAPDFPDIKKLIEGDDQPPLDEDELPTILPPKRRRVNIQGTLKSKPVVADMDRLVQEFPRHNWLENKYKKEEEKDVSDKKETSPTSEPCNTSKQCPDDVTKTNMAEDTTEMEVSTTTAVDEYPNIECTENQHPVEVTSEGISTIDTTKDDEPCPVNAPLDLCVKTSPEQRTQSVADIVLEPKTPLDGNIQANPCIIQTTENDPSDLSNKAKDIVQKNERSFKQSQSNIGISDSSCRMTSTPGMECTGHTIPTLSSVPVSNNASTCSTVVQGSSYQVISSVSSTSAPHASPQCGVQTNQNHMQDDARHLSKSHIIEGQTNDTNLSNTSTAENLGASQKTKEFDKEVYKHLIEYRQIQEREARMARERAELIKLKNEKANLLRQLGMQRKPRNLNGGSLGIQPINGDPNQSPAINLATTMRGPKSNQKQYKCQAELLGKIKNALRYHPRHGTSRQPQKKRTDLPDNPSPAHMNIRKSIVELCQEINRCKAPKPANIDVTGPYMKRKDPLTRPPFEFANPLPTKSEPPKAHSQTPFQSAGQLIYPLPSFLEHKTKLAKKSSSNTINDESVVSNAKTTVSSPCVHEAVLSEAQNKTIVRSEKCIQTKVQNESQQEIKHVSSSPADCSLIDHTVKNLSTTSSGNTFQQQPVKQLQVNDKNRDTELVVQRELNEALAKRQRFDDSENLNQKEKISSGKPDIPNSFQIDPKLFKSIQESAQEKIKEAERKQQQYTQRISQQQQQTRQHMLMQPNNPQQAQNDLITLEQTQKHILLQSKQHQIQQQNRQHHQQQQPFEQHVKQHIKQQQQIRQQMLQQQQQHKQQQYQQQHQNQHSQPQERNMQQFHQQNKMQVASGSTGQGQTHLQVHTSGHSRLMTPYGNQNVNPMIQTQLANRLRVPVNITSQSSNNNIIPARPSRESGYQDQLLVLQRPRATTPSMPQTTHNHQSQRVLVGARTVPFGTGTSGIFANMTETSLSEQQQQKSIQTSDDVTSDTRYPIAYNQTNSHGQVAVIQSTSAVNTTYNRYPVVTAQQHHNTAVPGELLSNNVPRVTHHQHLNNRPESAVRAHTAVQQATLPNKPTNVLSNNNGTSTNYGQVHTSSTIQPSARYTQDLPTTSGYSSSVVQQEAPPQLQQINGNCKVCGKTAMFLCSNCKLIWYCSQACQLNHWVSHSHECKSS